MLAFGCHVEKGLAAEDHDRHGEFRPIRRCRDGDAHLRLEQGRGDVGAVATSTIAFGPIVPSSRCASLVVNPLVPAVTWLTCRCNPVPRVSLKV